MNGELIARIGPCPLTDGPDDGDLRGHWVTATCAEYQQAIANAGGLDALVPWSSFTNMERSERGEPFIFTLWGNRSAEHPLPVVADGGHPDQRAQDGQPCRFTHAVFVPVIPEEST